MIEMPRRTLAFLLLGVCLMLPSCGNPTYTYRYRLTLEVEMNGVVHKGSSVIEVSETLSPRWSLSPGVASRKRTGEAPVVELEGGRVLVALFEGQRESVIGDGRQGLVWTGPDPTALLVAVYGLKFEWRDGRNEGLAQLGSQRGAKELQASQLPFLVTFTDINDPMSLVPVKASNLIDALGPGVRLTRATIEVTDAPVTRGIENKLPWLRSTKGYLDGKNSCDLRPLTREFFFCPDRAHFIRSGI